MANFGEPSTWGENVNEFLATQAIPKAKPLDEVEKYRKARIKALLDNLEPGWIEEDSMNWLRKNVTEEKGRTSFKMGSGNPIKITPDILNQLDDLIKNSDKTLKEISRDLDYAADLRSDSYLIKAYEREFGKIPSQRFKSYKLANDPKYVKKIIDEVKESSINATALKNKIDRKTVKNILNQEAAHLRGKTNIAGPMTGAKEVKKRRLANIKELKDYWKSKGKKGAKVLEEMETKLADIAGENKKVLEMSDDAIWNNKKFQDAMRLDVTALKNKEGLKFSRYADLSKKDFVKKIRDLADKGEFVQPEHIIPLKNKNPKSLLSKNIFPAYGKIGGQMEVLKDFSRDETFGKRAKEVFTFLKGQNIPIEKPGFWKTTKKVAGKAVQGVGLSGAAGLWGATGGIDLKSGMDRAGLGGEAAFAPALVKGVESATKGIKNPVVQKLIQRGLNLGMSLPMALRMARIASPIGVLSLVGEGIYQLGEREKAKREAMDPEELEEYDALLGEEMSTGAAEGGIMRTPFKKGGMDRRTFLKIFGGIASLPILGKFFKLAKPATKGIEKIIASSNAKGIPEWFGSLVRRVVGEGEDITKSAGVVERQTVHKSTLPESGTPIEVTQDLTTGDTIVDIGSGKHGFSAGHLGQPIRMELKKGEWIEGAKGKNGVKTKDEFTIAEAEFTGGHPENIKFEEITLNKYGEQGSDLTEVEGYARVKLDKLGRAKSKKDMSGLSSGKSHGWKTEKGKSQAMAEGRAESMADDIDIDDVEF